MKTQNNTQSKWLSRFDILLLSATAIISGLVSLFDFLGALDGIPWLANRIPTLTLLATGLVAAYLVIERRNQLESMRDDTTQRLGQLEDLIKNSATAIIQSLDGVEFKKFEKGNELLEYASKRLLQAQTRVDDLSWSSFISLGHGLNVTQSANQKYNERIFQISKKILYREVFIFNRPGRVEELKQRLDENQPGYSCAYFAATDIPLLQFMVIDDEEVIILSDMLPFYYAIRHRPLVELFSAYYEEIWKNANALKLGSTIIQDEVEKVLTFHQEQIIVQKSNSTIHGSQIELE